MTSYDELTLQDGSPREDVSVADIQDACNTHRRIMVELEIDLTLDKDRATKTRSSAQRVADTAKSTVKGVKIADKGVTAGTGYSVLKGDEVSDEARVKAGLGLVGETGKKYKKVSDEFYGDLDEEVSKVKFTPEEIDESIKGNR